METILRTMRQGALSGLKKGRISFLWMMEIVIPISFLTTLLDWSGWLHYLDVALKPAMAIINLPAAAALPIVIGMLTGIYGGIAAMLSLPLTREQMTLIGIFILTAHNLIQEGLIQGKSGIHPLMATLWRLVTATLTLLLLTPWFADTSAQTTGATILATTASTMRPPFATALEAWVLNTASLTVKAFLIIMCLLIALGLSPFWLYVPRLLMAIAAVHLFKLWRHWRLRNVRNIASPPLSITL